MKVGLIARMDRTGLGQGQTLRLARMLKPDYVMVIDSHPFNGNEQHPEWYAKDFGCYYVNGFPSSEQIVEFLDHVDVVVSCETFYNNNFTTIARSKHKKTVLIANYEFFDWHKPDFFGIPPPDRIIMPSHWHLEEMQRRYKAIYLPTPLDPGEFQEAREINHARTGKPRYLFINGRQAMHDRNGLLSLYEALKFSTGDFDIVIRAQGKIPLTDDKRVIYDFVDEEFQPNLYRNFDALILPRRYAGQCLPMTEALVAGLPVVMTDISPNNEILPPEWLVRSHKTDTFMTRTPIDVYSADSRELARTLDNLHVSYAAKEHAATIGLQFHQELLSNKYREVITKWN